MSESFSLVNPLLKPPLDGGFLPAVLANRLFERETAELGVPLVFGLEREAGKISRFETRVYPKGHPRARTNRFYAERLLKFLLWQRGGSKLYIGGPRNLGRYLQSCYSPGGKRDFDARFMGDPPGLV